jgi:hypothetical protein
MSNLEKYLGIKVSFSKYLSPFELSVLREKAVAITKLKGFNIDDFYVYVHSMTILVNDRHFAKSIPIGERIQELSVTFQVNQKQARHAQIKFFNDLFVTDPNEEISAETTVTRIFQSDVLQHGKQLKSELITYISKDLRADRHKKIKAHVSAIPSAEYLKKNNSRPNIVTSVDLKFTREVQLQINFSTDEQKAEEQYLLSLITQVQVLKEYLSKEKTKSKEKSKGNRDVHMLGEIADLLGRKNQEKALEKLRLLDPQTLEKAQSIGADLITKNGIAGDKLNPA